MRGSGMLFLQSEQGVESLGGLAFGIGHLGRRIDFLNLEFLGRQLGEVGLATGPVRADDNIAQRYLAGFIIVINARSFRVLFPCRILRRGSPRARLLPLHPGEHFLTGL